MPYQQSIDGPRPKMSLANINTGREMEVQHNPTSWEEVIAVEYARQKVPGLPHQQMQYVTTQNHKFQFQLFANSLMARPFRSDGEQLLIPQEQHLQNLLFRRFLMSLCYPGDSTDVIGGAPPRVLFVWPLMVTMTCRVTRVQIRHEKFNRRLDTIQYRADLQLEEVRDFRLLSVDALADGTLRPSSLSILNEVRGDAAP